MGYRDFCFLHLIRSVFVYINKIKEIVQTFDFILGAFRNTLVGDWNIWWVVKQKNFEAQNKVGQKSVLLPKRGGCKSFKLRRGVKDHRFSKLSRGFTPDPCSKYQYPLYAFSV